MGSSERKLANAVGGKSARACDNCVRKRARWYCAADDAFLCQSCDSLVHSANPLARRHERVRLKTSSSIACFDDGSRSPGARLEISVPTWHQGLTRKPRTPRKKKHADQQLSSDEPSAGGIIGNLVPEICSEENSHEENDEEHELLYRVPIFDPFIAELCTSNDAETRTGFGHEPKPVSSGFSQEMNHLHGFLPSEMDLAEFAADVESLLGKGLDDESFAMEGLGILDCDDIEKECRERVKVEDEEQMMINGGGGGEVAGIHQGDGAGFIDLGRETFELKFDYEEEDNKDGNIEGQIVVSNFDQDSNHHNKVYDFKKIFLRLDYEGVISAWDDHKSPWTTGERPDLDSSECWPDCMGTCGTMHVYGGGMMGGHGAAMGDGGREARVSRYREKRRTRLFSKKIRYEVRKLNAEKRPRMKGRFVKRANFVAPGFTNMAQ